MPTSSMNCTLWNIIAAPPDGFSALGSCGERSRPGTSGDGLLQPGVVRLDEVLHHLGGEQLVALVGEVNVILVRERRLLTPPLVDRALAAHRLARLPEAAVVALRDLAQDVVDLVDRLGLFPGRGLLLL